MYKYSENVILPAFFIIPGHLIFPVSIRGEKLRVPMGSSQRASNELSMLIN